MNFKAWIKAFRLRSLPLALACIAMGSILAVSFGNSKWEITLLSLLTTLFLQILSNLANDYGDAVSGVDGDKRKGPERAVQSGAITKKEMFNAIILFSLLSFLSGSLLIIIGLSSVLEYTVFFIIGILAIIAAIKYTMGKNPYGYAGLGDLSVFIFFGIVGVMGTYYLHTGSIDPLALLPAMSCSFFAVAVLNVNNIRDIESDKASGKISIPVRIGRKSAVNYHRILLIMGVLTSLIFVFLRFHGPYQLLFLIVIPLLYKNAVAVKKFKEAHLLDPYLKHMALTTLLFVVSFGIGQMIYIFTS